MASAFSAQPDPGRFSGLFLYLNGWQKFDC